MKNSSFWSIARERIAERKSTYRKNTTAMAIIIGEHRYALERAIEDETLNPVGGLNILWIMLNPSTADFVNNDATVRKVLGFTSRAGGGLALVANLFSFRATDPKVCKANLHQAVGPLNMEALLEGAKLAEKIVCAWGATPWARPQAVQVLEMLECYIPPDELDAKLMCIGTTKDGSPKHPLMPSYKNKLQYFDRHKYLGPSHRPIVRG